MKKKNKKNKNNNNSSKKKPKDAENSALRVRVALRAVRWGGAAIGAVSLPTMCNVERFGYVQCVSERTRHKSENNIQNLIWCSTAFEKHSRF